MSTTAHIPALSSPRVAVRPGTRRVLGEMAPVLVALVPLGWALGVTTAASPLGGATGWAGGPLPVSGAAHFALLSAYAGGAGALVALVTALAISLRGLIYSAALAERLRTQPAWFRALAPYVLVDQMFVVTDGWLRAGLGPRDLRRAYLTAGAALWLTWVAAITAGMVAGPLVPAGWRVELVLGALLVGMLEGALTDRTAVAASGAAAVVAVLATPLPARGGILVGAATGMMVAAWIERRRR